MRVKRKKDGVKGKQIKKNQEGKQIKKRKEANFKKKFIKVRGKGCVRICPRNLAPFCIVNYYIKWGKTSKGRNIKL